MSAVADSEERRLTLGQTVRLSANDERSLRAAYCRLAGYKHRKMLQRRLQQKQEQLRVLSGDATATKRGSSSSRLASAVRAKLQMEVAALRQEVAELAQINVADRVIRAADLEAALRDLGCPHSKKTVEYMIWEVDESLDGAVDWEELQLTYYRNLNDTTGLEPFTLCNIVQFLMYDSDSKGFVTEDDAMDSLFARYGKARLEHELVRLFGAKRAQNPVQGTLTLTEYLAIVSTRDSLRPSTATSKTTTQSPKKP